MASPFEQMFLSSISEKKRKRSNMLEALEMMRNVSLSEISEMCSVLSKSDILWLLQGKAPKSLQLADIFRAISPGMPKATKKTLLNFYLKDVKVDETEVEQFASLLLFCTEGQPASACHVFETVEILAPPISNCPNCQAVLTAQNKACTVTVFCLQTVKTALKLSSRCHHCKLNFGYSTFGNVEEGYKLYDEEQPYIEASDEVFLERNLCLLQVSLSNHAWVSFVGFAESYNEVVKAVQSGISGLPEELQLLSTKKNGSDPSDINLKNAEKVNEVVVGLQTDGASRGSFAAEAQGTEHFIRQHQAILVDCEPDDGQEAACNKDTGENQKTLRKWSRGLLHFIRGGGHIERWCPLYVSEGPGQVFLITLQYLLKRLEDIPEDKWEDVIISYDNMCNLDKLRVARKPLPFPEPYDKMWLKVIKIVDRLHMRNHKNPDCKKRYGSDDLKKKYPFLNTPCAEQTFVWSARFKKILCAMPKRRFLFFYHRMVVRRNMYLEACYKQNRAPEFPSIHGKND